LITNYGRVDEVWFDGANGEGPNGKKQVYDFDAWNLLIRKLQPKAVIAIMGPDVRWVGTESGRGRLTEWSVVPIHKESNTAVEKDSQKDIAFPPQGDMTIRPGWFYHVAEDAKVKTPEQLMEIYFTSVGRNGVLLLNIPPNKDGLISDSDLASLKGWKKLFDETFNYNFLKGVKVKKEGTTVEYNLKSAKTFDVLSLQEDISKGQRVEKFMAEYWKNNGWVKFTEGTTIGYKRLLKFEPITADKIRIRIEASRLSPNLSEFGLYKLSK
jgi:alpha-L-fucosidase